MRYGILIAPGWGRRAGTLLLVSSLVAAPASRAFGQSEEERAGARAAATEGAQAFHDQKWAEAVDFFTRAESLVHAPPHLLYIARAQVKMGQFVKAQENLTKIVRENLPSTAPKAFHDAQTEAVREIKDVESHVAYVKATVIGEAKNLKVTMDGTLVPSALIGVQRPVDPGEHQFRASGDGMTSDAVAITVKEGSRQTVEITIKPGQDPSVAATPTLPGPNSPAELHTTPPLSPAPAGAESSPGLGTQKLLGLVAGGVGVVGAGLGTVFGLQSMSKHSDAKNACPNGQCSTSEGVGLENDARSAGNRSTIFFALGGVGLAAGAVLWFTAKSESANTPSAQLGLGPGTLQLRTTW
jgi:hypothetical protein